MPVDAERWLAERGIRREPVLDSVPATTGRSGLPGPSGPPEPMPAEPGPGPQPELEQDTASPDAAARAAVPSGPSGAIADLDDGDRAGSGRSFDEALSFIRRSTSNAPQSEGRLRAKLTDRGYPDDVIGEALGLARSERIVDDGAMLTALIAERRARGHADLRLRRDLRDRGFTGSQVDEALAQHAVTDPAAAVFALAREQAIRHRAVDAEAAVRRTVGFLVRRGHSEAFARKAARDAVYADREAQQVAGR